MYRDQVINISTVHGAIWWIIKYFMQGDDFQAGRKYIKFLKICRQGKQHMSDDIKV